MQLQRTVDGFNDPSVRLSVNLWGAPALSPREFAGYQQDLVVGASMKVTAPRTTLALPINARQSIKLYAATGVHVRTGTDFDTGGVAWQYRWGAGH